MHTTINYGLELNEEKRKELAIEGIKNWLGVQKYNKQTKMVKLCQPPITFRQFEFMCAIGGIEGYPVRVWAEVCGIEIPKDEPSN